MPKHSFYIPQWRMWNWRLISISFVQLQLERTRREFQATESALRILDDDVDKIEQEIYGVWASANVQMMRAFEARLKEIRSERKRIAYVRKQLDEAMTKMHKHIKESEVHA